MFSKFICFVFTLTLVAGATRIIGGNNITGKAYPYQVSVHWRAIGVFRHFCGGVLVSPTWVLTAARCKTEEPIPGVYEVKAGITKLSEATNELSRRVVEIIVHPDYQGGRNPNDIALMRMNYSLELSEIIQPVKLPAVDSIPTGDATLTGWGYASLTDYPPHFSDDLQEVTVPIISHQVCSEVLIGLNGTSEPLSVAHICTGPLNSTITACIGDEGSPLVQNGELIGLVSWWISPCGTYGSPTIYTRVSNYITFIRQHITDK